MVEAHSINAEHKDLIHDVAFDYYGERMATCSTDQFVKVSCSSERNSVGCLCLKMFYYIFNIVKYRFGTKMNKVIGI